MPREAMIKIPKTLRTPWIENILEWLTLGIISIIIHHGHIIDQSWEGWFFNVLAANFLFSIIPSWS